MLRSEEYCVHTTYVLRIILVKQSRNLDKGASHWAISKLPLVSSSKRVLMLILSYEN